MIIDELPPISEGKVFTCSRCGQRHTVESGTDVKTGEKSYLLLYYQCSGKSYLAGINGRSLLKEQVTEAEVKIDEEGGLVCPTCGGSHLHHLGTENYFRDHEDGQTLMTYTDSSGASTHPRAVDYNPSRRRHAVVLGFTCEECEGVKELGFVQHKGTTYVGWR